MQYQPGSADPLTIEIPQEEMSSLLAHFSQEGYDAKVVFGRKGWCITCLLYTSDTHKCVSCGACAKACKMDVDITKTRCV